MKIDCHSYRAAVKQSLNIQIRHPQQDFEIGSYRSIVGKVMGRGFFQLIKDGYWKNTNLQSFGMGRSPIIPLPSCRDKANIYYGTICPHKLNYGSNTKHKYHSSAEWFRTTDVLKKQFTPTSITICCVVSICEALVSALVLRTVTNTSSCRFYAFWASVCLEANCVSTKHVGSR